MKYRVVWQWIAVVAIAISGAGRSHGAFDFETPAQLAGSPIVSGNISNFIQVTGLAQSGTHALRFDYSNPDPFQSFTYDMPFTIQDGTISVWFYDAMGANGVLDKFGGSIILEEAANPGNFLAVEIWNGPYPFAEPTPNYYISRGAAAGATTFRSTYFGDRSVGFHEVVFNLSAAASTVAVDGVSNASGAGVINGPGSSSPLRLRFMAWSASDGGSSNWTTDTTPTAGLTINTPYVFYDDLTVTATTPAANTRTEGFEIVSGTATYDTAAVFMGPSAHDNAFMKAFVPQWGVTTNPTFVHSGSQAISFINADPIFKSVNFNLSSMTPGILSLGMHDSVGADISFNKLGGSVVIEKASDPATFIALEVWNAPYPLSQATANYYMVKGVSGNPATSFRSNYFGDRSVGWHDIKIFVSAGQTRFLVDGIENADGGALVTGPGLADGIRLRLMADSPSCGGFTNYQTAGELNYLYTLSKQAPYLRFDDITLGLSAAGARNWANYR